MPVQSSYIRQITFSNDIYFTMFSRKLISFSAALLMAVAGMVTTQAVSAASPRAAKPVVSILGDSYSTYQDYIPEGNEI